MNHITLLRHHLSTLAMRCGHALHNSKDRFPKFEAGNDVMTPYNILYHLANMINWSNDHFNGRKYIPLEKSGWDEIRVAFFQSIESLDNTIKNPENLDEKMILTLYQGPLNDAMTHVGQLFTLRRLSGDPLSTVNYMKVDVQPGKFDYAEYYK